MNSDQIKGKWMQMRGDAKKSWGKITDDEWLQTQGDYEKLVGMVQERYGYTKDQAQKEVDHFRAEMDRKYGKMDRESQ